jgi:hypothetical protein
MERTEYLATREDAFLPDELAVEGKENPSSEKSLHRIGESLKGKAVISSPDPKQPKVLLPQV